jgi:hypothetical protein
VSKAVPPYLILYSCCNGLTRAMLPTWFNL